MVKHDNREENLWLFKNHTDYFKAHGSLNIIVANLIDSKTIIFDKETETYKIN